MLLGDLPFPNQKQEEWIGEWEERGVGREELGEEKLTRM